MEQLALQFFPYPHVLRGERREGIFVPWPEVASTCDRQCEKAGTRDLKLCSYGYNYVRLDEDVLVACVVVRDYPTVTRARQKRIRQVGKEAITTAELARVLATFAEATDELEADLRERKDAVIAEYRNSKTYQEEMLALLRPDLERALSQVHDYKQFVQQIIQNLNVILESAFPGVPLDEKLDQASQELTAIYWAALIMDEKIDAAVFMESPVRISEPREQGRSRLHGVVVKYVRIYQSRATNKGVKIGVVGESWGEVYGNRRALGIIPHTLIDNAIKYAPSGSRITLELCETDEHIEFIVESFGPKIEPDEEARIFDLFYRGRAAREMSSEGTGFGLASAQNIARAFDTKVTVEPSDEPGPEGTCRVVFRVRFDKV